jgi:hypothetical protein
MPLSDILLTGKSIVRSDHGLGQCIEIFSTKVLTRRRTLETSGQIALEGADSRSSDASCRCLRCS